MGKKEGREKEEKRRDKGGAGLRLRRRQTTE